jgi:hypothetical protein
MPYHLPESPFTLPTGLARTVPFRVPAALRQVLESIGHICVVVGGLHLGRADC